MLYDVIISIFLVQDLVPNLYHLVPFFDMHISLQNLVPVGCVERLGLTVLAETCSPSFYRGWIRLICYLVDNEGVKSPYTGRIRFISRLMTSRALYYASCASGDNRMAQIFLFLVWLSTGKQ